MKMKFEPQVISKALLGLAIGFLSLSGHGIAAEKSPAYEPIEHVSDYHLEGVQALARQAIDEHVYGICGRILSVSIRDKATQPNWGELMRDVLTGKYTEEVAVSPLHRSGLVDDSDPESRPAYVEKDILRALRSLGRNEVLPEQSLVDTSDALKERMLDFVVASTDGTEGEIMIANVVGAFSSRQQFIAIADRNLGELLIFGDGYCE